MIKVGLKTLDTQRQMDENALLHCGAMGLFMDTKWAKGNFISMMELEQPILVYNIDRSRNSIGSITHKATLIMIHKGHRKKVTFEISAISAIFILYIRSWKLSIKVDASSPLPAHGQLPANIYIS